MARRSIQSGVIFRERAKLIKHANRLSGCSTTYKVESLSSDSVPQGISLASIASNVTHTRSDSAFLVTGRGYQGEEETSLKYVVMNGKAMTAVSMPATSPPFLEACLIQKMRTNWNVRNSHSKDDFVDLEVSSVADHPFGNGIQKKHLSDIGRFEGPMAVEEEPLTADVESWKPFWVIMPPENELMVLKSSDKRVSMTLRSSDKRVGPISAIKDEVEPDTYNLTWVFQSLPIPRTLDEWYVGSSFEYDC